jgi:lipopolysaccharide export system permease protein
MILSRLDRYILGKFLGTFFLSILLIILIVIVFDVSEKIEDFLTHDVSLKEIVFDYYVNFIPYFINLFSPLFTFIAVIFFTSRLASRTEIVAILSAGVSFNRLLRPYMIGATIIVAASLFLSNYLLPIANKTRLEFEGKYVGSRFLVDGRDIHRQIAPGVFVYMQHYDTRSNIGSLFTLEQLKGRNLAFKLSAREIRWDSITSRWSIRDYTARFIKDKKERLIKGTRIDTTLNLSPKDFENVQATMGSMTAKELDRFTENQKMKGADVKDLELEKHTRIAFPFATFILTLIGVAVSSRKERGGIGRHLGIGIGLSFLFIVIQRWFASYAQTGVMPAWLAAWIPNFVFLGVCFVMLRRAPK